jgi:linoleate 10R-lipoxygenase
MRQCVSRCQPAWRCANDACHIGIDPPFRGVYRKSCVCTLHVSHNCIGESLADQTVGSLTLSQGQRVLVDLAHASLDVSPSDFSARRSTFSDHDLQPNIFPDPHTVNVNREPKDLYLTGDGVTRSLGVELTTKIVCQVLRAVCECNGVRRAPGLVGQLNRYEVATENTLRYEYLDGDFRPTTWPDTMVFQVSSLHSPCLEFR